MRPAIGIPLGLDDRGRWRPGRDYHYIDAAYAQAVRDAGGDPIYLPEGSDAASLLARVDALLLPGGDDLLPPTAYPRSVRFDPAPPRQVEFDRALLSHALSPSRSHVQRRDLPVLGICYGMQLLALESGGRLHYDLATDFPGAAAHRLPEAGGRHGIVVEKETRLASIVGASRLDVNSLHHQAIAELGAGWRVGARAEDGVIEAVERAGPGLCLGVQWHPEKLESPPSRALFEALVRAAAGD